MARVLSAGVIPVSLISQGCRYLLLRAYNYWDFPKGLVEGDETVIETALREVKEETGLSRLVFRWGEDYRETPPYGRGKVARYYVAESPDTEVVLAVSSELGKPEHHEYRWVGFAEARALLVPRLVAIIDWADGLTGCDSRRS